MTTLERHLIAIGFGSLLTLALAVTGDGIASWLFWPLVVVGSMLWQRAPAMTSSTLTPDGVTSAGEHSPCSLAADWDFGDCM